VPVTQDERSLSPGRTLVRAEPAQKGHRPFWRDRADLDPGLARTETGDHLRCVHRRETPAELVPQGRRCYDEFGTERIGPAWQDRHQVGRRESARVQRGAHHRVTGHGRIAIDLPGDPSGGLIPDGGGSGDPRTGRTARLRIWRVRPAVPGPGESASGSRQNQDNRDQD
jgi:hypothetical protein